MPIDYSMGKIYIIRSPNTEKVYLGSTVVALKKRFSQHKGHNNCKTIKLTTSKIVMDFGDAYIELLENFPCENKEQLLKREGELIRATQNCVNYQKCYGIEAITERIQEYDRQRGKLEHRKKANKEYIENNKDKISTQKREYRQNNNEKVKAEDKIKYQKNREKILKRAQEYYQKNKENIRKRERERYHKQKDTIE